MFSPLKTVLDDLRIVLATSSLQRQDILRKTGVKFEVHVSNFAENLDRSKYTFSEYVQETALRKLQMVDEELKNDGQRPPDIIIAMDTMVSCDGEIYGKPKDEADAARILKKLTNCGFPHLVYTGVALKCKQHYETFVEVTVIYMNKLSDEEILGYIKTGEPMGKAGAYAIQGIAGSFVQRIDGDFNNVIGLPLSAITQRLKRLILT